MAEKAARKKKRYWGDSRDSDLNSKPTPISLFSIPDSLTPSSFAPSQSAWSQTRTNDTPLKAFFLYNCWWALTLHPRILAGFQLSLLTSCPPPGLWELGGRWIVGDCPRPHWGFWEKGWTRSGLTPPSCVFPANCVVTKVPAWDMLLRKVSSTCSTLQTPPTAVVVTTWAGKL